MQHLEINEEEDHIHLLVETQAELVKVLKIRSAKFTRREYPEEVKIYYWKDVFLVEGDFVSTVRQRKSETLSDSSLHKSKN